MSDSKLPTSAPAKLIRLADIIIHIKLSATLEAQSRGCHLTVVPVGLELAVDVDPETLASAVNNLLRNAFKFTHSGSQVLLHAYANAERILIDVEDSCRGLPPGDPELLIKPFAPSRKVTKTDLTWDSVCPFVDVLLKLIMEWSIGCTRCTR